MIGNGSREQPILSVGGLSKRFGGLNVLDEVSLDVYPTSAVGLIGPNGAGKSTFIKCVTGFVKPDSGSITFTGTSTVNRSPDRLSRSGLVRTFQHPRLESAKTVFENVLAGTAATRSEPFWRWRARQDGVRPQPRPEALAWEALVHVGCDALASTAAGALTAGQQRLVSLARAIASQPRFLLLDEPAAGLGDLESEHLGHCLRELRNSGVSLLLVEHHLELVMGLCDQVAVLESGRIISFGTPDQVQADPHVIEAYTGIESDDERS